MILLQSICKHGKSTREFLWANRLYTFRQCPSNFFLWSYVKDNENKITKILNFANVYTTIVETLPRSMYGFLEWNCDVLSEKAVCYDPKVQNEKWQNLKKRNQKSRKGTIFAKIGINLFDGLW